MEEKVSEYTTTLNRATFDFQDKGLSVSIKLNNKFSKDSFALSAILKE